MSREPSITRHTRNRLVWLGAAALLVASLLFGLAVWSKSGALGYPAFVAAILGDRIQSMFLVAARLLAAVELAVQPDDLSLRNQTIRSLSIDYRVMPVSLVDLYDDGVIGIPARKAMPAAQLPS